MYVYYEAILWLLYFPTLDIFSQNLNLHACINNSRTIVVTLVRDTVAMRQYLKNLVSQVKTS